MTSFPILRSIGAILFALLTFALWHETHEIEALIFFAIALAAVAVTLPTLLEAVFKRHNNDNDKEDGGES